MNAMTMQGIAYRERPRRSLITYHLEVDERSGRPFVKSAWLRWRRGRYGPPFRFLDYADGGGRVISGELPDAQDKRIEVPLSSPDTLAVNALGQWAENPRVVALRNFIMGWDESGYTRCHTLDRNAKVMAFMDAGAQLGDLWMEGHFGVGDPLTGGGMPARDGGRI